MTLYLVRHGKAVDAAEDPDRPLSERGVADVTALAALAGRLGVEADLILHSGKRRAAQTAEIWSKALEPTPRLEEHRWLTPEAEPYRAAEYVEDVKGSVMICGHLPHLGLLLALLLTGDAELEVYDFPTAAIAAVERRYGAWRLEWLLTPRLLRAIQPGGAA